MKNNPFKSDLKIIGAFLFGLMSLSAASCAPTIDVPALTAEAKEAYLNMDETENFLYGLDDDRLQVEDITEGVIEDYITLIDFLADRNDLRAKTLVPPLFSETGLKFPRVVFFYRGAYKTDWPFNRPNDGYENCSTQCVRVLFEGHAESVLYAKIDPESLKVIPNSIREFRKSDNCSRSFTQFMLVDNAEIPGLGFCVEMLTPENGLALLEEDGLHVFGDQYHVISPLAPKEFWVDPSITLPNPNMSLKAYLRQIHVMKDLKHVEAFGRQETEHRAIGIRKNGRPIQYAMLYDITCLSIEPDLPETTVRKLIEMRAGKESLNLAWNVGDKLFFEQNPGFLCQGKARNHLNDGLFSDRDFDLISDLSPQEIEDRLNATLNLAKSKGDEALEWLALNKALMLVRGHPEFETEISNRIAPILIEVSKRERGN